MLNIPTSVIFSGQFKCYGWCYHLIVYINIYHINMYLILTLNLCVFWDGTDSQQSNLLSPDSANHLPGPCWNPWPFCSAAHPPARLPAPQSIGGAKSWRKCDGKISWSPWIDIMDTILATFLDIIWYKWSWKYHDISWYFMDTLNHGHKKKTWIPF